MRDEIWQRTWGMFWCCLLLDLITFFKNCVVNYTGKLKIAFKTSIHWNCFIESLKGSIEFLIKSDFKILLVDNWFSMNCGPAENEKFQIWSIKLKPSITQHVRYDFHILLNMFFWEVLFFLWTFRSPVNDWVVFSVQRNSSYFSVNVWSLKVKSN